MTGSNFSARISLANKVVMVTGAASGIGRAVVERAVTQCAAGVLAMDLDADALSAAEKSFATVGSVVSLTADVGKRDQVDRAVDYACGQLGVPDVLVNAAGNVSSSTFFELSDEEWHNTLNSHLKGVFNVSQAVLARMVPRGSGRVVSVASVAGKRGGGFLGKTAYSTAKAGVIGLTKAMAREMAPHGIAVNAVNPGLTDTPRLESLRADPGVWDSCLAAVPMGRVADPDEVAAAIQFLASDAASYITGETMNVDGGIMME